MGGLYEWSAGALSSTFPRIGDFTNRGELRIEGDDEKRLRRAALTNEGTVRDRNGIVFEFGTINNKADGIYDLQSGDLVFDGRRSSRLFNDFNNEGTFRKNSSSTVSVNLKNDGGIVDVQEGN